MAYGLAEKKYRVLLITLDQQQNTTYILMYDNLLDKDIVNTIYEAGIIDFIPSVLDMVQIDFGLQDKADQPFRISKAIKEVEHNYDYTILDIRQYYLQSL